MFLSELLLKLVVADLLRLVTCVLKLVPGLLKLVTCLLKLVPGLLKLVTCLLNWFLVR